MSAGTTIKVAMLRARTGYEYRLNGAYGTCLGYTGDAAEEIIDAANQHKPDILMAPEFFLYAGSAATEEGKDRALAKIASGIQNKSMLVIPGTILWQKKGRLYNTAPIITAGIPAGAYHKATNGWTSRIAENHRLTAALGRSRGRLFRWNGLDVGLEICLDHARGMLRAREAKADLHLIVSCDMGLYPEQIIAREGGYALLCDGFDHSYAAGFNGEGQDFTSGKNRAAIKRSGRLVEVFPTNAGSIDLVEITLAGGR